MLRVDLGDWEGEWRYATYTNFRVDDAANKYKLHVSGYNGTAGQYYYNHSKYNVFLKVSA